MNPLRWLRDSFARLFAAAPELPKSESFELPTRIIEAPKRKAKPRRMQIGRWSLAQTYSPVIGGNIVLFPPQRIRMEASRGGHLVEFDGLNRYGSPKWRIV